MLNRKSADRIIVKSNERMKMVLDWYFDNFSWLDREEFLAPMESGVVELQDEALEFTFESKGSIVEIVVYATTGPDIPPIVAFDYDPVTTEIRNRRVAPAGVGSAVAMNALGLIISADNMPRKEARKYHALMLFMAHYREVVEIEQRVEHRPAKPKKKGHRARRPQPLIRRIYTLGEFQLEDLPKAEGTKRKYTKPAHEVNVRGFLRHYKSGKTVWVRPSVRYKGKPGQPKEYEL